MALSAGQFSSATSKEGEISAGSASILGTKKSASSSSNIQIFTREGRHIAGTTLSGSEIASLLVKENGFSSSAQYRADYLILRHSPIVVNWIVQFLAVRNG